MTHRASPLCLPNPNTAVLFLCLFYRREEPDRVGPISGPAKILTYASLTQCLFSFQLSLSPGRIICDDAMSLITCHCWNLCQLMETERRKINPLLSLLLSGLINMIIRLSLHQSREKTLRTCKLQWERWRCWPPPRGRDEVVSWGCLRWKPTLVGWVGSED